MRDGGASNRSGTQFIGEVKDSTKTVRLIPFVFNNDQTYVLEFGDQYIRVIRAGAYVSDLSLTITNITQTNPAVLTYTGTDPANGDEFAISGVVGMTQVNGRNFKVANVNAGANTFELDYMDGTNVNSVGFSAYTSGGTAARIYTISSTYLEADLMSLNFVQSADVMTIVHPTYPPRELSRSGHATWSLSSITFSPSNSAPTGLAGPAGTHNSYKVTAIKNESFEESLPSSAAECGAADPSVTNLITLTWNTVSGSREYNVYRKLNGVWGFIGIAGTNTFVDNGYPVDQTDTPPVASTIFNSTDNYPSAVAYVQQRLMFANTNTNPETIWGSRVGFFNNFTTSTPVQDDDRIKFTMAGERVNRVRHILNLRGLVVFTADGEWSVGRDGVITPFNLDTQQHAYNGSSELRPLVVGSTALYVQARGAIVRDLSFSYERDGYTGNDLTAFSSHLFDGYELADWAYQKIPHSIIWAVRDDGILLSLTYVPEHELWAWARHDFGDDTIENVCVVPEGEEDSLYLVMNRTVDGSTVRYVERMYTRLIEDIADAKFLDCALSYDGRNTNTAHTMTLSGGTTWVYTEDLTLTSSTAYFTAADVGNAIHLEGAEQIRCEITGYTSTTVVTVRAHQTVPAAMRSTAISDWAKAVDQVTGLWHIEGEQVSIFADGFVVASPNNASMGTVTVTNGTVTLSRPYAVIHVGLPYISDIETLDIDLAATETLMDKSKMVGAVSMRVEKSRGMWVGPQPPTDDDDDPLEGLVELKLRNTETYDEPMDLSTGVVTENLQPDWNSNGRVFVRQVDPVPLAVVAIAPAGMFPVGSVRRKK
jgi:hypothetical protein